MPKSPAFAIISYIGSAIFHCSGWVDRYYGSPCSPAYVMSYCSCRILATSTNSPQFLVKVHIPPLKKFCPETPMGSKDHMRKIFRIGIVVFPQLSFFSFEKSQNYGVTSGNHCWAFYGGNYDKVK